MTKLKINEGDAVIVDPRGAIGIVTSVLPFGDDEISDRGFHCNSVDEWKYYWLTHYNILISDFDKVVRVIFVGDTRTYDYPITTIRKVIHFRKFTRIFRWCMRYNTDYIPIYRIFKRSKLYVQRIKDNRYTKKYFDDLLNV